MELWGAVATMSETHRHFFNRRAGYLLISGAFVLLIGVFFFLRSSEPRTEVVIVKVVPVETSRRDIPAPVIAFDSESYYRRILAYNLFRPLGWRPPVPREPYHLIGTILPRSENTPPKVILQTTTANPTTYIVSLGESLDADTEVVEIQAKQVVFSTSGQKRTLRLDTSLYLNASHANRAPSRQTPALAPQRRKPFPIAIPPCRSALGSLRSLTVDCQKLITS